jgi:FAD/FMN-containing dehydrogenase
MDAAHHNRWVEVEVDRLDGRKSLYSSVFYEPEDFWARYGGPAYRDLKGRYDPDGRLQDLYAKCVQP